MEDIKQIDSASITRAEQLREAEKPKSRPKEGKSPFDELLDQSRELQSKMVDVKTQKDAATKEALPEAEKYKERQRDRSGDSEKEDERKQDSSDKRENFDGGRRVFGKANLKQQQGNSNGNSSGEGGSSQKKGERSVQNIKKLSTLKGSNEVGQAGFVKELQSRLIKQAQTSATKVPQDVLNQIVRTVRLGIAADGARTFTLDCHEEVFKGLKLRFKSRSGKVQIEFLTANAETKALFEKERDQIRETLTSKGIAVEEIHIS